MQAAFSTRWGWFKQCNPTGKCWWKANPISAVTTQRPQRDTRQFTMAKTGEHFGAVGAALGALGERLLPHSHFACLSTSRCPLLLKATLLFAVVMLFVNRTFPNRPVIQGPSVASLTSAPRFPEAVAWPVVLIRQLLLGPNDLVQVGVHELRNEVDVVELLGPRPEQILRSEGRGEKNTGLNRGNTLY